MDNMIKSAMRWLLYLLSACLILWAVFPELKSVALGLAAGFAVSAMNAFLLKRRVGMIAEAAIQEGAKKKGMGFGNRIASVLLLAMIAYKYPDILNMPAALIGSMVMPFLLLAAAIVHTLKENSSGKG
ncbi:ATP synthase subunit I [Paenibacillus paeoniae]|uniref:ATP synthase subunit I n=1 Tax=Paenibacillus paeoniae TaxID=2292705 RepID=A0A371P0P5_9BACL|nr:ATP synthase subunit I [Paenibacillus paeoniae]REK69512.1 ATP synthase subunit I [Paenibacillus paeoniae]